MGTTELAVKGTTGVMPNLAEQVPDEACRAIASPAEAQAYQGSGWSTMLAQVLAEPGPRFRHRVEQTVVSFPSANEAGAFFNASAQSWPACADRHFTLVAMGTNMPHTAGPVSNTDGTLSITQNQDGVELIYGCQRALTVANNLVVDVMVCSLNQTDVPSDTPSDAAINIAHQIAAKAAVGNNNNPAPSTAPETSIAGPPTRASCRGGCDGGAAVSPDQINTTMGATGITVTNAHHDGRHSAPVADKACLPLAVALIAPVYAGSGWTAFREQGLNDPAWTHVVDQGVVLFSFAPMRTRSSPPPPKAGRPAPTGSTPPPAIPMVWTVGRVSNTNGTLSATENPYVGVRTWDPVSGR